MREAQERQKVPLTPEEQRRHYMIERSFHDKQAALERQSFKYLDIFEQQMREQKQARKEFYENK
jgi:hypothetical protein